MASAVPLEDDGSILQSFWGLSSVDEAERTKAARDLLLALAKKREGELQYSTQRLVRGLASGRKGARQGFFVALTELLSTCGEVTVEEVLRLVNSHLHLHHGVKGAEEKGILLGRYFALSALSLSGRLTDKGDVLEVTRQFAAIAAKKPLMSEMCAVAIGNLVVQSCCHGDNGDEVTQEIVREGGVEDGWVGCTPERLYLLLSFRKIFGDKKWWAELFVERWGGGDCDVFTSDQLDLVGRVAEASCSSHPRLHSMWPLLVAEIRQTSLFPEFWERIFEGLLVSSTHKKQLMAINILTSIILPTISVDEVPTVFSSGIVHCILNNASSPNNYLHKPVQKLLVALLDVERLLDVRISFYVHLQYRTSGRWDALSKTPTMKSLLSSLGCEGGDRLISKLENVFHSPEIISAHYDSDDPMSEPQSVRTWVGDQFLAVVRNKSLSKSSSSLLNIAKLLLSHSYHTNHSPDSHITAAVDTQVQTACHTRLVGVLAKLCTLTHLISHSGSKGVSHSLGGSTCRALHFDPISCALWGRCALESLTESLSAYLVLTWLGRQLANCMWP